MRHFFTHIYSEGPWLSTILQYVAVLTQERPIKIWVLGKCEQRYEKRKREINGERADIKQEIRAVMIKKDQVWRKPFRFSSSLFFWLLLVRDVMFSLKKANFLKAIRSQRFSQKRFTVRCDSARFPQIGAQVTLRGPTERPGVPDKTFSLQGGKSGRAWQSQGSVTQFTAGDLLQHEREKVIQAESVSKPTLSAEHQDVCLAALSVPLCARGKEWVRCPARNNRRCWWCVWQRQRTVGSLHVGLKLAYGLMYAPASLCQLRRQDVCDSAVVQ